MQISKHKNTSGVCMRWVEWIGVRTDLKRGSKPTDRMVGRCVYSFKKGGGKYTYVCKRRLMTYGTYTKWMQSGSIGSTYNAMIKGKY